MHNSTSVNNTPNNTGERSRAAFVMAVVMILLCTRGEVGRMECIVTTVIMYINMMRKLEKKMREERKEERKCSDYISGIAKGRINFGSFRACRSEHNCLTLYHPLTFNYFSIVTFSTLNAIIKLKFLHENTMTTALLIDRIHDSSQCIITISIERRKAVQRVDDEKGLIRIC